MCLGERRPFPGFGGLSPTSSWAPGFLRTPAEHGLPRHPSSRRALHGACRCPGKPSPRSRPRLCFVHCGVSHTWQLPPKGAPPVFAESLQAVRRAGLVWLWAYRLLKCLVAAHAPVSEHAMLARVHSGPGAPQPPHCALQALCSPPSTVPPERCAPERAVPPEHAVSPEHCAPRARCAPPSAVPPSALCPPNVLCPPSSVPSERCRSPARALLAGRVVPQPGAC